MDLPVEPLRTAPEGRLMSLDALRGFDMFWITGGHAIVLGLGKGLNNGWFDAHVLPQIQHVPWQGFTAWDLIMPLFLFMVGTAMPFSFGKRLARGESKGRLLLHVLYRVVILWILGMIAQGQLLEYDPSRLRLYSNTLQAIAAGYLIASILVLTLRPAWQFLVTVGLLLGYWGLLTLVPVPGYGAGQLTPEGNLAIYIDKLILGRFQDGTTYTWILSGMTFATTVMLGVFAGEVLRADGTPWRKAMTLLCSGVLCVLVGWAWGFVFPIIKHIWTSSMVLFAGGWSLLLLGLFYIIIDVLRVRRWAIFFVVIGTNAIAAYMATHVFDFRHISNILVHGLARWTGNWYGLIEALAAFAVLWLILWFLHRRRVFIKI